jgi:hypothetical protein
MSLTDPDARNARVGHLLEPLAWVLALLSLATSPIAVFLLAANGGPSSGGTAITFLLYVLLTVGFGLMLYYTSAHKSPLGIVSFVFAYAGGLVLILGAQPAKNSTLPSGLPVSLVPYGVSLVLLIIYIVHTRMGQATLTNGIETTATVTSAGVNCMVNYVTHWKLTLKFTDQSGKERWFHLGRTGYGYRVGQQFTIKYNGNKPGSRFGIVILGDA